MVYKTQKKYKEPRVPAEVTQDERPNEPDQGPRTKTFKGLSSELGLDNQNTLSNTSGDDGGTNISKSLGGFASDRGAVFGQQRLQLCGMTLGRHPP